MARIVYEGKTNVYWATSVASKTAPTVAEITAAVALTNFVAKDGVEVNFSTNNVDSATIAEVFDAQIPGSYGVDITLTMFRDNSADTAWTTCVYNTAGYLIIDRFRASGTLPSAGHKVEVYPATMHQPSPENSAANTVVRFVEKFTGTSAPAMTATVA
jgi:hypothetical protein